MTHGGAERQMKERLHKLEALQKNLWVEDYLALARECFALRKLCGDVLREAVSLRLKERLERAASGEEVI